MKSAAILLLCLITGCASLKVNTSAKADFDFSRIKKYCWLAGCEFSYSGPVSLKERFPVETFEAAVVSELAKKGYELDESDPDFLVNVTILLEEKTHKMIYVDDFQNISLPYGIEEEIRYLKGTLLFDAIDFEKTEVFWRSAGIKFLDAQPRFDAADIQLAMEKMLQEFPAAEAR